MGKMYLTLDCPFNWFDKTLSSVVLPTFIVFQAIVMVLEATGDTASPMMMKLLQSFWKTGLITVDQMNRVYAFVASVLHWLLFKKLIK